MNFPRIIPVLLLSDGGIVKTTKFKNPIYIGDPVNAVRIFNEKEVDEIILFDIEASKKKREPNYSWIKDIISESFMPVGYGGGINSLDTAKKLFDSGLEKVILNTNIQNINLIEGLVEVYGSQSIVACVDIKKTLFGKYSIFNHTLNTYKSNSVIEFIKEIISRGVGEIIVQSVNKEGSMSGLDLQLIKLISDSVDVPVVASGGVGSLDDISDGIKIGGATAIAIGSFCVFKGKNKGILINYPKRSDIENLYV